MRDESQLKLKLPALLGQQDRQRGGVLRSQRRRKRLAFSCFPLDIHHVFYNVLVALALECLRFTPSLLFSCSREVLQATNWARDHY
jgi:hypothetical protein